MTQTPHEARRERIAAIIEPQAFAANLNDPLLTADTRQAVAQVRNYARARADEILADDPALVLVEALASIRVFIQDSIDNGHLERSALGNAFGIRDTVDAALAAYQSTDKGDAS